MLSSDCGEIANDFRGFLELREASEWQGIGVFNVAGLEARGLAVVAVPLSAAANHFGKWMAKNSERVQD